MDIEKQFNLIAEEYDSNRRRFIPCFDELYDTTTDFIAANIRTPKSIVDLGAGTGLLTYFWYRYFRDANYMLVDVADDMIGVAKRRFKGIDNISYSVADYKDVLPSNDFDTVISALSIHHLEDSEKESLFNKIYSVFSKGGIFINYDQFCAGDPKMNVWFDSYWERQLFYSGLSERDIELWKERRKLDRECSLEQQIDMLKRSGFETVKCIYACRKFAVVIAIK